ncbi:hypothetical protein ACIBSV_46725 [Embleya sp. NPDC050154]|uniref:hypothetical protein n=1 Tax=Embleya sp. NPDC050154 TaxID=3363988 RepID=UPI0037B86204
MADEGVAPGSLTRRWDEVPEGRRVILYLAQRRLGLSPGEWDALSWDRQRCYLEGMEAEGLIKLPPREDVAEGGFAALAGDISSLGGYQVRTKVAAAP